MPERIRLVDRIVEVLDLVTAKQSLPFTELFDDVPTKEGIIVTFLSILELVRLRLIRAYQFEAFGDVQLRVLSDENDQREKLKETLKSRES
jgi:segregation and condensation protein A